MPDANGKLLLGDPGYQAPGTGLINTTPGQTTVAPGTPVTSYTPAAATAIAPTSTSYTPMSYTVAPNQTVQQNMQSVIEADSPLMQQARKRSDQAMSQRGLLNSSLAIGAGQEAVLGAALPIAQADAGYYNQAAMKTTDQQNAALNFGAAQANAATNLGAQLGTSTNVQNATAANQAMAQASDAATKTQLTQIQNDATLTGIDKQTASAQVIANLDNTIKTQLANIQANTTLTATDKQTTSAQLISQSDNLTKAQLAIIQSSTTLTATDKQTASAQLINASDNLIKVQLSYIQQDTTLSAIDKQTASAQLISRGDNDTRTVIQASADAAALARQVMTVDAQLAVARIDQRTKTDLAQLDANNRQLLQTNVSIANMYQETVKNIAAIAVDKDMNAEAKRNATASQFNILNEAVRAAQEVATTNQAALSGLDLSQYFGGGAMGAMDNVRYTGANGQAFTTQAAANQSYVQQGVEQEAARRAAEAQAAQDAYNASQGG